MRRRNQKFSFQFEQLERRRLLTGDPLLIKSINQDGDFVGPDASVGPDGIADVHVSLGGLITGDAIISATIIGTIANDNAHPLYWSVGSNPIGNFNAEILRITTFAGTDFPSHLDNQSATGELYLSPPPANKKLTSLAITLVYNSQTNQINDTQTVTDTNDPAFANLSSILLATGESVPSSLLIPIPGGSVHFVEQYSSAGANPTHSAGDVHLSLDSIPSGYTFNSIVAAYLSDGIASQSGGDGSVLHPTRGNATWTWALAGNTTVDSLDLKLSVQSATSPSIADLTFPPIRSEVGTPMTLRLVMKDASQVSHSFYTQFAGGASDVNIRGANYNHTAAVVNVAPAQTNGYVSYQDPISGALVTATLQSLLSDTSGRFDRIYLTAGTYNIDYSTQLPGSPALLLSRPIQLDGNPNAILTFTADSTAPSSLTQIETDYGPALSITSSHVTLSNFKIRFLNQVYFAGDFGGTVIHANGLPDPNKNTSIVDVNLSHLDIQGPAPAAHYSIPQGAINRVLTDVIAVDLKSFGDTSIVGRFAQRLFIGDASSGTIDGLTLRGGGVIFNGGPWNVTNNHYVGTVPTIDRYPANYAYIADQNQLIPSLTDSIFLSGNPHDQVISDNTAVMTPLNGDSANPIGTAYRFLFYNGVGQTGYHNLIQLNTVGGGVGRRMLDDTSLGGNLTTSQIPSATYHNLYNAPEVFLNENYLVKYEGRILPFSSDAHIFSLPPVNTTFYRSPIIAGDIVAILTGPNAGMWRRIAQVLDSSDFLMDESMPSGDYRVSVVQGLVDDRYDQNTVDLRGTTSTAFNMTGNQFKLRVTSNTIMGDNTTVLNGNRQYNVNVAILVTSGYQNQIDSSAGYAYSFPVPNDLWTHDPLFDAVVDDNVIQGSLGGIQVNLAQGGNSSIGRTYLTAEIKNNHFSDYRDPVSSPAIADASSVISIGSSGDLAPTSASGPVSHIYYYALLDANKNAAPNSDPSLGYAPTISDSTHTYNFADPKQINVMLAGNIFIPSSGAASSRNQKIVSAIVNSIPVVYSQSNATTALPSTPAIALNFAFADSTSPIPVGFTRVTNSTNFSASQPYGFTDPRPTVTYADANSVYGTMLTFREDLPAGSYLVTASLGSQNDPKDGAEVFVEGAEVGVLNTGSGAQTQSYVAVVLPGGSLLVEFIGFGPDPEPYLDVHLHSLTILPLSFAFTDTSSLIPVGMTPVNASTTYAGPSGLNYGFLNSAPRTSQNADTGAVYATDQTFQVDLPSGRYDITAIIGD